MRRLLLPSCVLVAVAFAALGTESAFATNNCPTSSSGYQVAGNVGASFTTNGNTATYSFQSLVNESPSGGIPGLMDYCVYPGTTPDSMTTSAVGGNGAAWGGATTSSYLTFSRPDGDVSNIPLDGSSQTMGTATWSGGVPQSQTILLHLNDPTVCNSLYHQGPQSCYALPSDSGTNVPASTIGGLGLAGLLGLALVGSVLLWRKRRQPALN